MGKWVGVLAVVCASSGCGQTVSDTGAGRAGSGGSVGGAGSGATSQVGGTSSGMSGNTSNAGASGGSAGAGVAGWSGESGIAVGGQGGAATVCEPVAHSRPAPSPASKSFSDLAPSFVGVYQIDAVFAKSTDCSAMCSAGNSLGGSAFAYRYIAVQSKSGGSLLDVIGCASKAACADSTAVHVALGSVDTAVSDEILSSQRTSVENPQGQACTGASVSTWLLRSAALKLRVDMQSVNVGFAATYDATSGLYACGSADVDAAAMGKPCNDLEVVDATKVD